MTTRNDPALAARLYASHRPDLDTMKNRLPVLGESLDAAAHELARDPSLDKADEMLCRLAGATEIVRHLRRALAAEIHGHGTGKQNAN